MHVPVCVCVCVCVCTCAHAEEEFWIYQLEGSFELNKKNDTTKVAIYSAILF
jgi:hypothetical protein